MSCKSEDRGSTSALCPDSILDTPFPIHGNNDAEMKVNTMSIKKSGREFGDASGVTKYPDHATPRGGPDSTETADSADMTIMPKENTPTKKSPPPPSPLKYGTRLSGDIEPPSPKPGPAYGMDTEPPSPAYAILSTEPPSPCQGVAVAPDVLFDEEDRIHGILGNELAPRDFTAPNLPQKTFVSLLQEIGCEKGKRVHFELMSSDSRIHDPTFVYCASYGEMQEYIGTGAGKSKKVARHMAARQVLQKMFEDQNADYTLPGAPRDLTRAQVLHHLNTLMPDLGGLPGAIADSQAAQAGDMSLPIAPSLGPMGTNPVGILHELTSRHKWPIPEYIDHEAQGEAHDRVFVMECQVGRFSKRSEGKSKKVAKRRAAEEMLQFLLKEAKTRTMDVDILAAIKDTPENEEHGTEGAPQVPTGAPEPPSDPQPEEPNEAIKAKDAFQALRDRDFASEPPSPDHLRLLKHLVSKMENWQDPEYRVLSRRGQVMEHSLCILELKAKGKAKSELLPISVHGEGNNDEMATFSCAQNALEVLSIYSRSVLAK